METNPNIVRLLDMLDQPDRYTEQEIDHLVNADEECRQLYQQMAEIQQAYHYTAPRRAQHRSLPPLLKMAALFAGVLLLSVVAYAAIRLASGRGPAAVAGETTADTVVVASQSTGTDTTPQDSIPATRLFENTPLDELVIELAAFYHKEPLIQDTRAHDVRLYYKWSREATLQDVVGDLNHFDRVNLTIEADRLIVKP